MTLIIKMSSYSQIYGESLCLERLIVKYLQIKTNIHQRTIARADITFNSSK